MDHSPLKGEIRMSPGSAPPLEGGAPALITGRSFKCPTNWPMLSGRALSWLLLRPSRCSATSWPMLSDRVLSWLLLRLNCCSAASCPELPQGEVCSPELLQRAALSTSGKRRVAKKRGKGCTAKDTRQKLHGKRCTAGKSPGPQK